jgi:hypothetical protein
MNIIVKKIFQSPCTPPVEVSYSVVIENLSPCDDNEDILFLRELEKRNYIRLFGERQ